MTAPLDTCETREAESSTTSVPIRRTFLRMGLKVDGGILSRLTWSEAYCFLQVVWNGPVRPSRIFGMEDRNRERSLARLVQIKWIERTEDGYRTPACLSPQSETDTAYLWLWPLRFGHISVAARVLLCLIDEYTGGRWWCNRTQLARSLGIHKDTLYKYLDELGRADLIASSGRGLTCFRHLGRLKDSVMEGILRNPKYLGGEALEEPEQHRFLSDDAPVPLRRSTGSSPTHGLPLDARRAPPTRKEGRGGVSASRRKDPAPLDPWKEELLHHLLPVTSEVLRRNGAVRIPRSSVLSRDLTGLLKDIDVLDKHRIRFRQEVETRVRSCSSFMWTGLLGDVVLALDAARRVLRDLDARVAQDARQKEQDFTACIERFRETVEGFRSQNVYDVERLVQPETVGGVPRLSWVLQNRGIAPWATVLDPVTAEAGRRLGLIKAPGTMTEQELRSRIGLA